MVQKSHPSPGSIVEDRPVHVADFLVLPGDGAPAVLVSGARTVGSVLTAAIAISFAGNPSYQWQRSADGTTGWGNISGATSSTYTIAQAGYHRCVVSGLSYTSSGIQVLAASGITQPFGAQNWKLSNTAALRAGITAVRGNTGRCRILFLGDSYLAGYGSTGAAMGGNARSGSLSTRLVQLLSGGSTPASADYTVGDGDAAATNIANLMAYDSRLSHSGAVVLASYSSIGGGSSGMVALTGTDSTFTFTPGTPFDTVDLVLPYNTLGQGNFDVLADGVLVTNLVNNTSISVGFVSIPVPAGTTAVTFRKVSGSAYTISVGTRNSTSRKVELINAGASGIRLSQIATTPVTGSVAAETWNSRAALPLLLDGAATNFTFVQGWFNDRSGGRTIAQAQADLRIILNDCLARGGAAYLNYPSLNPTNISVSDFRTWSDAMIAVARDEYDLPIMDMSVVIPSYSAGQTAGYYADNLHLSGSGHQLAAQTLYDCIAAIL